MAVYTVLVQLLALVALVNCQEKQQILIRRQWRPPSTTPYPIFSPFPFPTSTTPPVTATPSPPITDTTDTTTRLFTDTTTPLFTDTTTPPFATTSPSSRNCNFNPCYNGGECLRTDDSAGYQCRCPAGFTGLVCQEVVTPPPSPTTPPYVHRCEFNPCYNGGFCVRVGQSFTCVCPETHGGPVCEQKVVPTTPPPTTPTTPAPTAPTTPACADSGLALQSMGCTPAEVVFMVEYGKTENRLDVDHEGDFIKDLIAKWNVGRSSVRVGVVLYHDTVTEAIHLEQFPTAAQLTFRINSIIRTTRPSGNADLGTALDYVRSHSFQSARPGVPRVVIPIVHQLPPPQLNQQLVNSAQELKDDCVQIMPLYVAGTPLNTTLVSQLASQPFHNNYHYFSSGSFTNLERYAQTWQRCRR